MIAAFNQLVGKREAGQGALEGLKNAPDILSALGGRYFLEKNAKILEDLTNKRSEAENKYIEEITKIAQVKAIIEERQTEIDRIRLDASRRNAARTGRDLTFGESTSAFRGRLGRLNPGGLNPTELANAIIRAQARSTAISGSTSLDAIAERTKLAEEIKNNTNALNLLKDSTDLLAAIEDERKKIESSSPDIPRARRAGAT